MLLLVEWVRRFQTRPLQSCSLKRIWGKVFRACLVQIRFEVFVSRYLDACRLFHLFVKCCISNAIN